MDELYTYRIEVLGRVDEKDLNAGGPLQMTVAWANADTAYPDEGKGRPCISTPVTVCTDQSGLIGLLRHLHGRGLVLLSMRRER